MRFAISVNALRFGLCVSLVLLGLTLSLQAPAQGFDRQDVKIKSQGLDLAAWFYLPKKASGSGKRPAIVMAHGWSAVKEMYLDKFAERFAEAGFAVVVFDYRSFGGSQGEPRGNIVWYEQLEDYRNAITWVSQRTEVDPARIGIWGTSYSGAHVLHLAAFDKRVRAVVSQMPPPAIWETYYAPMTPEDRAGMFTWVADARAERYRTGKVATFAVVSSDGKDAALPWPEAYKFFTETAKARAPSWKNEITVESVEKDMFYEADAHIHLIAPIPLLMVIASDDIVCPTEGEKNAFARAGEPKKLVVVQGGHFDLYQGPGFDKAVVPTIEWFKQHLKP